MCKVMSNQMGIWTLFWVLAAILSQTGTVQNPKGDSLLCYDTVLWFQTIGCLGAAPFDFASPVTGRQYKAGQVFPTPCAREAEEIWLVKPIKGSLMLHLRYNTSQCLSMGNDSKPAQLEPCDSKKLSQHFLFEPVSFSKSSHKPDYKYFYIQSQSSKLRLIYDVKHGLITKKTPTVIDDTHLPHYWNKSTLRYYCDKWVWTSDVEHKARPLRRIRFSFPIRGKTNPLKPQYIASLIDQMMASTAPYPPIAITTETCNKCEPPTPCDCFPIDYNLTKFASTTVTLDITMKAGGVGYEYRPSRNRIPTGMYAKPWEPIWIKVDDFDLRKVTIRASLFLNAYLVDDDDWPRPPQVTVQHILMPGMNKFRSPFGGPLTLEVIGNDTKAKSIKVIIYGVPMASFVLGKTTEKKWRKVLLKEPNWITFQGEYVVGLDIKAPYQRATFAQIVAMVKRFDLMFKNNYLISGYDFDADQNKSVHAIPRGWHWWMRDASHRGFMYSGNPVTVNMHSDKEMTLTLESWALWGFAHEFAHNLQTPCFSHALGLEVTNNIYVAFQIAYFCGDGKQTVACGANKRAGHDFLDIWKTGTLPALASRKTYSDMEPLESLVFWLQIFAVYGFEPFRNMNKRFRKRFLDPSDKLCRGDNLGKIDAVYETLCEMTGHDLTTHFDFYRIPISKGARKAVAARNLAKPMVNISAVEIAVGTPLSWRASGKAPSYALPPFKSFLDAQ